MASTRKSVIFSAANNFFLIGVSLVLMIVVTRWLMPAEIGAFAVAYAIFAMLELLRESKLVAYVLQSETVDEDVMRGVQFVGWSTAAITIGAGVLIGLLMYSAFDTPEVGDLLLIMTVGLVIKTLVQPARSILAREMRFGFISSVSMIAAVVKAVVTIGLLVAGLRVEAMAIGVVAEIAVELAFLAVVKPRLAFPLPSRAHTGPIWNFCLKFTGSQLVNRVSTTATDLLIGSFLGLAAAGFFNRASTLTRKLRAGIEGAILPVANAVFAKSHRKDRNLVRSDYLAGVSMLTGVTWSALFLMITTAEPLILAAYGQRWATIVPLVEVLCLSAIIHAATAMAPTVLASIGEVDTLFKRNMAIQIPRLLILLITVQFDLMIVAWGYLASMVLSFYVNQSILWQKLEIGFSDLAATLSRSAAVAGCCAIPPWLMLQLPAVDELSSILQLAICIPLAGVCWLTSIFVLRHPMRGELLNAIRKFSSAASA